MNFCVGNTGCQCVISEVVEGINVELGLKSFDSYGFSAWFYNLKCLILWMSPQLIILFTDDYISKRGILSSSEMEHKKTPSFRFHSEKVDPPTPSPPGYGPANEIFLEPHEKGYL